MAVRDMLAEIEQRAVDAERHVSLCGPCDGGLPMACTCSTVDPRETISGLITVTRAQNAALRAALGYLDDYAIGPDGFGLAAGVEQAITEALAPQA